MSARRRVLGVVVVLLVEHVIVGLEEIVVSIKYDVCMWNNPLKG